MSAHRTEVGGERACWADLVCDGCGAIGGEPHRANCQRAESSSDVVHGFAASLTEVLRERPADVVGPE